jgi:hypothetical protein
LSRVQAVMPPTAAMTASTTAIRLRRLYLMPGTLASPARRETREKPPGSPGHGHGRRDRGLSYEPAIKSGLGRGGTPSGSQ